MHWPCPYGSTGPGAGKGGSQGSQGTDLGNSQVTGQSHQVPLSAEPASAPALLACGKGLASGESVDRPVHDERLPVRADIQIGDVRRFRKRFGRADVRSSGIKETLLGRVVELMCSVAGVSTGV